MMDKVFLRQLAAPVYIGVYPEELKEPQIIYIDLEINLNIAAAAQNDDLSCTVDYAAVYHFMMNYLPVNRYRLLETLATQLADTLMTQFPCLGLCLTITKHPKDLPLLGGAGVSTQRGKINAE